MKTEEKSKISTFLASEIVRRILNRQIDGRTGSSGSSGTPHEIGKVVKAGGIALTAVRNKTVTRRFLSLGKGR
jgi:hypothetical protein